LQKGLAVISLDTNVVVRIFVDDPDNPEQTRKVREIVRQYKTVYITQVVQIETVWVLKQSYDFARAEITLVLERLLNNQAFKLENEAVFAVALQLYRSSNIDFADALILQNSRQQNLNLLSFDRKLQKQQGVVSV
jgi:predicted nucleic-acid-binding protein